MFLCEDLTDHIYKFVNPKWLYYINKNNIIVIIVTNKPTNIRYFI